MTSCLQVRTKNKKTRHCAYLHSQTRSCSTMLGRYEGAVTQVWANLNDWDVQHTLNNLLKPGSLLVNLRGISPGGLYPRTLTSGSSGVGRGHGPQILARLQILETTWWWSDTGTHTVLPYWLIWTMGPSGGGGGQPPKFFRLESSLSLINQTRLQTKLQSHKHCNKVTTRAGQNYTSAEITPQEIIPP